MAETNASPSIIATPTGGGALSGLGETFSPDLFTGTGNFTVPLAVPAGRNGLAPTLSLGYSTGSGNGPFGLGWALNVPGVSRKTSHGIPRYDDSDVFLLSGAEDLVMVGQRGSRTTFRPRTEGLFARIERVRDAATNDFWEIATKEGLVSRYGTPGMAGDDPAVVADPQDRRKVFSWRLTETVDPFGNRIVYDYHRDRPTQGVRRWDELYLKRIRYVDFENAGVTQFLVSVEFYYDFERNDPFLTSLTAPIRLREDPCSSYNATFEIRTRHRCALVAVRTHPGPGAAIPARAYRLTYLDERTDLTLGNELLPANAASLLSRVDVIGFDDAGAATTEWPSLDFQYTQFQPASRRFVRLPGPEAIPSLAFANVELVDLHGGGLPDILQMSGDVRFWRNLGGGTFAAAREMRESPLGVNLSDAGVALIDANGDGRSDLLVHRPELSACFSLEFGAVWQRRPATLSAAPAFDLQDPDVKLLDLDGDGVTDALRAGAQFECFFNDRDKGWHAVRTVPRGRFDEFPDVAFSDPRVRFADMSGDGLQDIVLVHSGSVAYWPNLGRGDWGARIPMAASPSFPPGYDPRRILLGDLDGDGLADLVSVENNRVLIWFNRGGNGWSERPVVIPGTPSVTDVDSLRIVDLYGNGTTGVLFSLAADTGRRPSMYFLDLTGGVKPYLLRELDNNLGATTRVQYAPSTRFYIEDEKAGTMRWRTPLPFPVQVVSRVEVIDGISKGKLTTEYRYHHGYWDGAEREFRGFGMVEQFDSESFEDYHAAGLHGDSRLFSDVPRKSFSQPTLTRSWFHQGPVGEEFGAWVEKDYSSEYWTGDPQVLRHTETIDSFLTAHTGGTFLDRRDRRDALRALRGSPLREELYGLDGSIYQDRPYTVTERAYDLREESAPAQPGTGRRRIFYPHLIAQRTTQWERGNDPLTVFAFTADFDAFGQPRQQTSVAPPRRQAKRRSIEGAVVGVIQPDETRVLATHSLTHRAGPVANGRYIHDRVWQTHGFEPAGTLSFTESAPNDVRRVLHDQCEFARALHRSYVESLRDWIPGTAYPGALSLVSHRVDHYDGQAFQGRNDDRVVFGALTRSESLTCTDAILDAAYAEGATSRRPAYLGGGAALPAGAPAGFGSVLGYRRMQLTPNSPYQAGYYADTVKVQFDFQTTGVPPAGWSAWPARGSVVAMQDALGHETQVELDRYWVLPVSATDDAGLRYAATYNYRVLQAQATIDPSGNTTQVRFTPHGMPSRRWIESKPDANGDREGGTDAEPDVSWTYDALAYQRTRSTSAPQPISVRTSRRIQHASDHGSDATIDLVEYCDGRGRIIQKRAQAAEGSFGGRGDEVGLATQPGAMPTAAVVTPALGRTVVSGWQTYDNKGRVVGKFEPFFGTGWTFQPEEESRRGRQVESFHAPRGNVVAVIDPNGSQERVILGRPVQAGALALTMDHTAFPAGWEPTPWESYSYDANDLAPVSVDPVATLANGEAAPLTSRAPASHHFTPGNAIVDALGRVLCQVQRNGANPATDWYITRASYDLRGNQTAALDALGRPVFRYAHDLARRLLRVESLDAGLRTFTFDACGSLVEHRDSKGAVVLREYDALNRPSTIWARDDAASPSVTLRERVAYGDGGRPPQTPAETAERDAMRNRNALGRPIEHWDEAGVLRFGGYDFKGNLLTKTRQVVSDLAIAQAPAGQAWTADWSAAGSANALDPTLYETTTSFDALNRPTAITYPRDVGGNRHVLRPRYGRSGGLEAATLFPTAAAATGDDCIKFMAYNAYGQRVLIEYGNGLMTRYAYDRSTLRLARVRTEKRDTTTAATQWRGQGDPVQDSTYSYDLAGTILGIDERVPNCGVAAGGGDRNRLLRSFTYDPLYRLLSATGRACLTDTEARRRRDLPACGSYPGGPATPDQTNGPDLTEAYTETFQYDPADNMLDLAYSRAGTVAWRRVFGFGGVSGAQWRTAPTHRLTSLSIGQTAYTYAFDLNGNLLQQNTGQSHLWDHADRMIAYRNQPQGAPIASVEARYLYSASGIRVKKWVRASGNAGSDESTVYIDGLFEHHRSPQIPATRENNVIHVKDGQGRLTLVRVGAAHREDAGPAVQYHLADHLGSSSTVTSADGTWLSREEFFPYGETSFGSFARKRFRYSGKERDAESGLTYYGARYYAPWLQRWISCDAPQLEEKANKYLFLGANPLSRIDPTGMQVVPAYPMSGPIPQTTNVTPAQFEQIAQQALHEQNVMRAGEYPGYTMGELGLTNKGRIVQGPPGERAFDADIENLALEEGEFLTDHTHNGAPGEEPSWNLSDTDRAYLRRHGQTSQRIHTEGQVTEFNGVTPQGEVTENYSIRRANTFPEPVPEVRPAAEPVETSAEPVRSEPILSEPVPRGSAVGGALRSVGGAAKFGIGVAGMAIPIVCGSPHVYGYDTDAAEEAFFFQGLFHLITFGRVPEPVKPPHMGGDWGAWRQLQSERARERFEARREEYEAQFQMCLP